MIQKITGGATMVLPTTAVENRVNGAQMFQLIPTATGTLSTSGGDGLAGQVYILIVDTVGTSSYVITLNSAHFRSTGTLTSGTTDARRFILMFVSDGVMLNEVSRTAAMA